MTEPIDLDAERADRLAAEADPTCTWIEPGADAECGADGTLFTVGPILPLSTPYVKADTVCAAHLVPSLIATDGRHRPFRVAIRQEVEPA